jgi:O-antigen ligase
MLNPGVNELGHTPSQGAHVQRTLTLTSSKSWTEALSFGPPMLLLLWACYAHGAFLEPSRTIAAVAAPGLGLIWAVLRGRIRTGEAAGTTSRWSLAETLFVALAALGATSALWSLHWPSSLEAAGILFGGVFFVRLGCALGRSPSARSSVLLLLSEVGVLLSLLSVVGYVLRVSWLTQELDGKILPTGTFGYANALAGFLFLSLAATVALFVESNGGDSRPGGKTFGRDFARECVGPGRPSAFSRRLLLATAAILQVATIVLTQSRAAAVIVVLLLLLVAGVRIVGDSKRTTVHRWLAVGAALVLVVGGIAVAIVFWGKLRPHLSSADVFRLKTWQAALKATKHSPILGHGLGTFYQAYAPFKLGGQTTYAHNIFVQNLVELGAVGVSLIAALLAVAVLRPLKVFLGPASSPQLPLLLGLQAFVLQNLVDLTWYFPALLLTFALLLGLTLSYSRDGRSPVVPRCPTNESENTTAHRLATE